MEITIGDYSAESKTVPVTFKSDTITHERTVNACLDPAGNYDPGETEQRVAEVAQGVMQKIALGVITNPPAPEPVAEG